MRRAGEASAVIERRSHAYSCGLCRSRFVVPWQRRRRGGQAMHMAPGSESPTELGLRIALGLLTRLQVKACLRLVDHHMQREWPSRRRLMEGARARRWPLSGFPRQRVWAARIAIVWIAVDLAVTKSYLFW